MDTPPDTLAIDARSTAQALGFASPDYELIDFGGGRKLERFGPFSLDRPAPAAQNVARRQSAQWPRADARYERHPGQRGRWLFGTRPIREPWAIAWGPLRLELKLTEFGHLGLFPEQAGNWAWTARQVRAAERPLKVLNLFAYTGASTLAAAAAGAAVTHVDAAANVVAWARRNAELSGLGDAPIRWIADDALKFARREWKRGVQYDAVILDPPGYGHGPKGESWKLAEHLAELWSVCLQLTRGRPAFLLASCHSEPWTSGAALAEHLARQSPSLPGAERFAGCEMTIASRAGEKLRHDKRLHPARPLSCGVAARWSAAADASGSP